MLLLFTGRDFIYLFLFCSLITFICSFQALEDEDHDGNASDSSVDSGSSSGPNFNYILNMPLWCLSKEKVDELLKQRDLKARHSKGTQHLGEIDSTESAIGKQSQYLV